MGTLFRPGTITKELFKKAMGHLPTVNDLEHCNCHVSDSTVYLKTGWDFHRNVPAWLVPNDGRVVREFHDGHCFAPVHSQDMKNYIFSVPWSGPYAVIPSFGLLPVAQPGIVGIIWEFPAVKEIGDRIGEIIGKEVFKGRSIPMGPTLYSEIITIVLASLTSMVRSGELIKNPWTQMWELIERG